MGFSCRGDDREARLNHLAHHIEGGLLLSNSFDLRFVGRYHVH